MQVRDIMRQLPQIIGADCTAQAAAERMAVDNIGFLVVGDEHHLDGVITDRDIVVRCVATGKDAALTPVRDIMSISVLACRPSEMVGDVIGRMMEAGITRLPVVNRKGQHIGHVTSCSIDVEGYLLGLAIVDKRYNIPETPIAIFPLGGKSLDEALLRGTRVALPVDATVLTRFPEREGVQMRMGGQD